MTKPFTLFTLTLLVLTTTLNTYAAKGKAWVDPKKAAAEDPSFTIQGEYFFDENGKKVGAQVIALGKNEFRAELFKGGLPGKGWKRGDDQMTFHGMREGDKITLKTSNGKSSVTIDPNGKTMTTSGEVIGDGVLKKIVRKSPTLGAKPPKGATVLFNGKNLDQWKDGARMTKDGLLMEGCTTKPVFGSYQLHIEFRLPYQPEARGQGRGNSGLYNQGKYEVQMLDSFGLKGRNNECGGIYSIADPKVNMCLPPLTWQTYDVTFHAEKYNDEGKRIKPPSITVKHNGVIIHENLVINKKTTAAPVKGNTSTGPIHLQNHGNPVRYRNIWLKPIKD